MAEVGYNNNESFKKGSFKRLYDRTFSVINLIYRETGYKTLFLVVYKTLLFCARSYNQFPYINFAKP